MRSYFGTVLTGFLVIFSSQVVGHLTVKIVVIRKFGHFCGCWTNPMPHIWIAHCTQTQMLHHPTNPKGLIDAITV
jgi:hypothetical protein